VWVQITQSKECLEKKACFTKHLKAQGKKIMISVQKILKTVEN